MKTCYTREQIEKAVKMKGYKWFEDVNDKGYDVNIVGVRNKAVGDRVTNRFDDHITVSYKVNGVESTIPFSVNNGDNLEIIVNKTDIQKESTITINGLLL